MDVLHFTSRKRESYQIKFTHSLLWEAALGIAAITNSSIIETLDQPSEYWKNLKESLSKEMLAHLDFVEKNNTWKALLQVLQQKDFLTLSDFFTYLESLTEEELRYICIPYLGKMNQEIRSSAAHGNQESIRALTKIAEDIVFFPNYIEYICTVDSNELKSHLSFVMQGWYGAVIEPKEEELLAILARDMDTKIKMEQKMTSEELVEWATGGITYYPEPGVYQVLLIPQMVYRPWNIEADVEGVKVFFYPVANDSIHPGDTYQPSNFLVHKYKALGDEVRLKIIKHLSEGSQSLQYITDKLEMGKSTIHHHLKILRSAKLVEIIDSKYALKREALNSIAKELDYYLYEK